MRPVRLILRHPLPKSGFFGGVSGGRSNPIPPISPQYLTHLVEQHAIACDRSTPLESVRHALLCEGFVLVADVLKRMEEAGVCVLPVLRRDVFVGIVRQQRIASLSLISRRNRMDWGLVCRSAARSSRPTTGLSRPGPTGVVEASLFFTLPAQQST